ncbi:MAG TPA: lytic murein transglycosylase, partial [Burkholderiaceae bacterium]
MPSRCTRNRALSRPQPTSAPPHCGWLARATLAAALTGCAAAASTPPPPSAPSTASAPAQSDGEEAAHQQAFASWITNFRAGAQAAGIDAVTLRVAFDDVHYLPRIVELDRAQPEFTRAVWDYLDNAVSPQRVARGQDKLLQVRDPADAAAARYGVPPTIVVA